MTTEQNVADRDWWRELGNLLGWRVYGWTFRSECTYRDSRGRCIELTGPQRDEIMAAIGRAAQELERRALIAERALSIAKAHSGRKAIASASFTWMAEQKLIAEGLIQPTQQTGERKQP